jgi:hypothetical protein
VQLAFHSASLPAALPDPPEKRVWASGGAAKQQEEDLQQDLRPHSLCQMTQQFRSPNGCQLATQMLQSFFEGNNYVKKTTKNLKCVMTNI